MSTEVFTILLLLLIGGAVCAALHWIIGRTQRKLVERYAPLLPADSAAPISFKNLLIAWAANGLRLIVWSSYLIFAIKLISQTQPEKDSFRAMLSDQRIKLLNGLKEGRGIDIAIILIVTIFIMRFSSAVIKTAFEIFERRAIVRDATATLRRYQTLSAILRGTAQSVILFIGTMVLLQQLGIGITAILASAGVVGLAIGFGAQSLIKDLFSGFLILLEDQYSVGDTVKIGDVAGTVEQLTLRITRIRGLDGSLTTIPNGSIAVVSNMSKDWSRVVLDVEISTTEDIDRAMGVLIETAKKMKETMPNDILEEPLMLGVDKLSSNSVTVRLMIKTPPAKHFEIGRELRRRIKLAFEREGIKAPMPQQQLVMTNAPETREKM
ncbi:MAG: mechanosensitive ion channel family protein [Acidobacteria bacterium]|nr:mechanosensitive ion channel family protein [Acidobacteriota bacterium]